MTDAAVNTLPLLVAHLMSHGDRPFLGHGDRRISARDTAELAYAYANELVNLGVRPKDRVAICLEKRCEKVALLLACGIAGAVSVVINPRLRDAQVAHVLRDCDPELVWTSEDKMALLAHPGRTFGGRRLELVDATRVVTRRKAAFPKVEPAMPATILYTSGSTGLPKGIVQSHRSLCDGARIVSGYLDLSPKDHLLAVLPLSFDYGLNQVLAAAWAGAQVTLLSYLAVTELMQALSDLRCTGLAGVPTLWVAFCEALRDRKIRPSALRSLRYVTNSGGRLGLAEIRTLRELLPKVEVFSMYGLTEAFRSTFLPPAEIDRIPGSIGRAIPEVEILVVDPETGKQCADDAVGELVHAGALIADGYWRRATDTARAFRADPRGTDRPKVVYSGDLVRRDADGWLWFVGRRDKQLKVMGYRVSPEEVERELERVPGVAKACVFGVADARLGQKLVAGLQAEPATAAELSARVEKHMRARVPPWLQPGELHVLEVLPTNPNGKPDAAALRALLGFGEDRDAAP